MFLICAIDEMIVNGGSIDLNVIDSCPPRSRRPEACASVTSPWSLLPAGKMSRWSVEYRGYLRIAWTGVPALAVFELTGVSRRAYITLPGSGWDPIAFSTLLPMTILPNSRGSTRVALYVAPVGTNCGW